MKIVNDFPPNYDDICKVFPSVKGKKIAFCWDDTIFLPYTFSLAPEIIKHEEVHSRQQLGDPQSWWNAYLSDPEFRLGQELAAHRIQYKEFCRVFTDRNKRHRYLFMIARFLASPTYGNIIKHKDAMEAIAL